jgi:hypothetical protein
MSESTRAAAVRKVAAEATVSMDGHSSTGPQDDMSWAMGHIASGQSELYYEGIWRGVSTALLGRTNWEGFTSVWPAITNDPASSARTRDLGNWLATVEKVVSPRPWSRTTSRRRNGPTPGSLAMPQPRCGRSRVGRAGTSWS